MIQPFILATAGHVDHGKSALVKALTGTDPDRLPEEKARGITIDLGFAHLELPAPPAASADPTTPRPGGFSCGIIDVPGHEDFVKNMVAGVGAIDLALLVVAADDGWMPQTEEHLQILLYLGVTRGVVALTKVDLAADADAASARVRERLAGTPFANAPIVPTSVLDGRGLSELRDALAAVLAQSPPPPDFGKPRLAVDRVFTLKGIGTVVTGTLTGGSIVRGDSVILQPSGRPTRIRSCHSHGREVERVLPGTRAGLNLADLSAGDTTRGEVVTRESFGAPSTTFDVVLEKSDRIAGTGTLSGRPLKSGSLVRLHLGSTHLPAVVHLLRGDILQPGGRGLAQLRLETPVFAFAGDRFILRDAAEQATLAGGVVLDPDAPRARARAPERLTQLESCAARPNLPDPFVHALLERAGIARLDALLVRSRFSVKQITAAVGRLVARRDAVLAGSSVAAAGFWSTRLETLIQTIDLHHEKHPERLGIALADLRAAVERVFGDARGFEELLTHLGRDGFNVQGASVRRSSHQPVLPPALQAAGQRIRDALARTPFEPRSRRELTPDSASHQALRYLIQNDEAVELGPDVVLSATAFHQAKDRITALLRRNHHATASDLRLLLGSSRRIVIPLLERLDRDGITTRDGDVRRLRTP